MNDTTKLPGHTAAQEQSKIEQALKAAPPVATPPDHPPGSAGNFEARLAKLEHAWKRVEPIFNRYFGHEADSA